MLGNDQNQEVYVSLHATLWYRVGVFFNLFIYVFIYYL